MDKEHVGVLNISTNYSLHCNPGMFEGPLPRKGDLVELVCTQILDNSDPSYVLKFRTKKPKAEYSNENTNEVL